MRSNVVFPHPDGPSSVKNELSAMSSDTPCSAVTVPYRFTALRMLTAACFKRGLPKIPANLGNYLRFES
jgi:hypothetical protein